MDFGIPGYSLLFLKPTSLYLWEFVVFVWHPHQLFKSHQWNFSQCKNCNTWLWFLVKYNLLKTVTLSSSIQTLNGIKADFNFDLGLNGNEPIWVKLFSITLEQKSMYFTSALTRAQLWMNLNGLTFHHLYVRMEDNLSQAQILLILDYGNRNQTTDCLWFRVK